MSTVVSTVEYGIVKFFKEDKKFGFVTVLDANGDPTKTELFFHYNNGYFLREGATEVEFRYETGSMTDKGVKHLKLPEKGDKIVFVRGQSTKGEKVAMWGQAAVYDSLIERITNRPVYRVVKTMIAYGRHSETVIWEGKDVMELSATHYMQEESRFGRMRVYDTLDVGGADGGDMTWWSSIQRQQADGSWTDCEDPRVFLCCVPSQTFREFATTGRRQETCFHRTRR